MDKYIKQVEDIYLIISSLGVSGDAVDVIAAVRSKLRKLMEDMAAEKPKKEAKTDG